MSTEIYDVIIVGAGIAGLTVARSLSQTAKNTRVCLIEGRSRIGGRLKSISTESGKVVDLGIS